MVLAAAVLVVVTVGTASWVSLDSGDAALVVPSATSAATPAMPNPRTVSPRQAAPSPSLARPTARAVPQPAPKRKRTSLQLATGLRADGTALGVPRRGSGHFTRADRRHRTTAQRGRLLRFDVSVEKGLAIDPDEAALLIAAALDDKRGWRDLGLGRFTLVRAGARVDLHAYIATPRTTDRLCAPYRTLGRVSCQNGRKVVLNARRWVHGSPTYGKDVIGYRRYLVNHEFGHALGRRHVHCPGRGRPAPVMVQQTKSLGGCRANPWPARTRG